MEDRQRLAEETSRLQVLQRVDEQRSAVLRSVSHDLRTPLATIKAVASDLRDGAVHDEATRTELLDSVVDQTERLDRLVANLLNMSRIEAGALVAERQAVDVEELLRDCMRRLGGLFRNVRVQLDVSTELPLVDGDYTQLEQLVTNLLENAARHAPPGSLVRVAARSIAPTGVEVSVADEGIGIAPYERSRIFEPFQRGEGSRSSGVGLAICKAVAEAHDGSIEVLQTDGGGATFVVRLPARHD
jgi:two-component system sensor histidine kinase KdpD